VRRYSSVDAVPTDRTNDTRFFSSPNRTDRLLGPTSLFSMSSFPRHKAAKGSTAEKKNTRNNTATPLRLHGLVNNYAQELYFNHISGIQDFIFPVFKILYFRYSRFLPNFI